MGFLSKITGFGSSKSFAYLDDLIHNGEKEIVLNSDIKLGKKEEAKYSGGIKIDVDNLIIDGNGHTIDAKGKTRIFHVTGKNVIIKNVTLENGFTTSRGEILHNGGSVNAYKNDTPTSGGAIKNKGELIIINSTISNNRTASNGGAIYNDKKGKLKITDSILSDNTAVDSYNELRQSMGGAIHNNGKLNIKNSTISNNITGSSGGAINNYGTLSLHNMEFDNNIVEFSNSFNDIDNREVLFIKGKFISNASKTILNRNQAYIFESHKNNIFNSKRDSKAQIHELKLLNENQKDFTYLDQLINDESDEIILKNDIALNIFNDEDEIYLEGIRIDRDNLIIDGNNHTIEAQNYARIFNISGKNITIKNINLKNCSTREDGGAIKNKGELNIINTSISNNTSEEYGGAIKNEGKLNIMQSTMSKNIAKYGGAIKNEGELKITESTFTENTSTKLGGLLFNEGKIDITDSQLCDNLSKEDCGAIFNEGDLSIESSNLYCNKAIRTGGVIGNKGKLSIIGSEINDNNAKSGGAFYNSNGELNIFDSSLSNNLAELGSAIYVYIGNVKLFNCKLLKNKSPNHIILNKDSLQINNTIFNYNESNQIISNENDESNIGIFNGKFIENNIEDSVIHNDGKSCTIDRTIFENNLTSTDSKNIINLSDLTLINPKIKDNGKTILNNKYILIRSSSQDLENKIIGNGKIEMGRYIPPNPTFDFGHLDEKIRENKNKKIILEENICFEEYEIDFYEGGIELDEDNLIIDGNGMTIDGANRARIFHITGKNITLKNIIFKNGYTHKNHDNPLNNNGSALKIDRNGELIIENCEFVNNISEGDGGAIHNKGELRIINASISNNTAKNGGAIYNKGELTISNSEISLNPNAIENHGKLDIVDSNFSDNSTVISNWGNVSINNSILSDNKTNNGAIYNKGRLNILKSTISNNISSKDGGAINNEGKLCVSNSILSNNTAKDGGAIYNNSELKIIESTISNNNAERGSAIKNNNGNVEINSSSISSNCALTNKNIDTLDGITITDGNVFSGTIDNWDGKLFIDDSKIYDNIGNDSGGVILSNVDVKVLINCTFKNNQPEGIVQYRMDTDKFNDLLNQFKTGNFE